MVLASSLQGLQHLPSQIELDRDAPGEKTG